MSPKVLTRSVSEGELRGRAVGQNGMGPGVLTRSVSEDELRQYLTIRVTG